MSEQTQNAKKFLSLHTADEILVLLNAWDVASARIFEAAGARAIGTTSMGIAATHGYADVQCIPLDTMLETVSRMAAAVRIPVSADMEAGYGETTEQVVASILRAVDCGIVGINLEDGTGSTPPLLDPNVMAERIAAIRQATTELGLHLVINARTDVYLEDVGPPAERLAATIARGNTYREAGADCIFVPGGLDRDTIRELSREIDAPLNVVANPAISIPVVPAVSELQALGVSRVSVGSGLTRAALSFASRAAQEVLRDGTYNIMSEELANAGQSYETAIGKA